MTNPKQSIVTTAHLTTGQRRRWDYRHPSNHSPPEHFHRKTGEPCLLLTQTHFEVAFEADFLIGPHQGVLRHKSSHSLKAP